MLCGIDQVFGGQQSAIRKRLRGARVGVLTHSAAVDRRGRQTLAVLEELGVSPALIFSPEHGLDAYAQAEEAVSTSNGAPGASRWSAPIVSLYGDTKESLSPTSEDLSKIDLLLIDLADVGSRYYTFAWSALLATRAAAAANVHTLVLDRPNPISGNPATLEGAPQRDGFLSFVGLEPLPVRHAMTIGELVAHFCEKDGLTLGSEGAVSVIPTQGWERHRTAEAWGRPFVMPSPNMPTLETALVYPGGCLLEGTNLSEGRGTTAPFQLVGAPFLDGDALAEALVKVGVTGAQVRPVSFRPMFDKHAGKVCQGVMLHVTDALFFRPLSTYLALITLARAQAPDKFAFRTETYEFEATIPAFDLLTGSAAAREAIEAGASPDEVVSLVALVDAAWRDVIGEAEARLTRVRA
jgi:uncharacterized protein YbbC (DUF1343 family)